MKKKRILIISVIMLIFIIFFTLIILSNKMNEKRINLSITMNSKISDIVYDENNTKYTIESLLEKILLLESQFVEEKTKLKDFIAKQSEVNKNLQSAFEACSKYIKSLQDQNIKLQNELNNLKEGK